MIAILFSLQCILQLWTDRKFIRAMKKLMTPIKAQKLLVSVYAHDKVVIFTLLAAVVGGLALPYQPAGIIFGCFATVPASLTLLHGVHQRRYRKMQEEQE